MTDANLVLGRLLPHFFPRIFGPTEDEGLSVEAARGALQGLADLVAADEPQKPPRSLEEVAMGFIRVANEAMSRPIRALTEVRLPNPHCLPHIPTFCPPSPPSAPHPLLLPHIPTFCPPSPHSAPKTR